MLIASLSKLSSHSPRSEALVFAPRPYCYLILRSVCQLCGWTVPRLVRGTLYATGFLNFLSFSYHYPSEKSEVLSFATGLLKPLILTLQRSPKYSPLLPDFLISYHFLIIILQRGPKYFPLLPDLLSNYYL